MLNFFHQIKDNAVLLSNRHKYLIIGFLSLFTLFILFAAAPFLNAQEKSAKKTPPLPVVVQTVKMRNFDDARSYTGRVEAIDKVELRARVEGYLKAKYFKDGDMVKRGQVLFLIDPASYEITVKQAEANLISAEAAERLAKLTYERNLKLIKRKVVSQSSVDDAQSKFSQAKATTLARKAALDEAKLQLGYTKIIAPMDAKAGRADVSIGDYINSSTGSLVTLVAQDPVYISFPVPQHVLLAVRKAGRSADDVYVKLKLADGSIYGPEGKIVFADATASSSSNTILIRASIANDKGLLIDQQLVEVFVYDKTPVQKLSIPQAAILIDGQGSYVFLVEPKENKVVMKRILVGAEHNQIIEVKKGLSLGEKVIIQGLQKVRPGAIVKMEEAKDIISE